MDYKNILDAPETDSYSIIIHGMFHISGSGTEMSPTNFLFDKQDILSIKLSEHSLII